MNYVITIENCFNGTNWIMAETHIIKEINLMSPFLSPVFLLIL